MSIKLQQPVAGGGVEITNFFNGRLISGADLTREQAARREAVKRLGRAVGKGIADGLEVVIVPNTDKKPVVSISPGTAVNACGQVLCLTETATVDLLQRLGAVEQSSTVFTDCKPPAVGAYAAGFGLYLLVLSPVFTQRGSAPVGGLKNSFAACSSDVILETVQFRLLPVDNFLSADVLPDDKKLRNYLAYRCFGVDELQSFYENPLELKTKRYGLLDEMQDLALSSADVPLAIINWTAEGLQFVEMWAVRRRLTRKNDREDWTQLFSDRRISETEAMIQQFADQIRSEKPETNNLQAVKAVDNFYFLPPVGMLPLATEFTNAGFNLINFFGNKRPGGVAVLDGERMQPLLREALNHEPIDLDADEKLRIYVIKENFMAAKAGHVKQITAIFAKSTLPDFATARFDFANWDFSRFV